MCGLMLSQYGIFQFRFERLPADLLVMRHPMAVALVLVASCSVGCGKKPVPTAPDPYAAMYGSWRGVVSQWARSNCDYCWYVLDSVRVVVTPGEPFPVLQLSRRPIGGGTWTDVPIQITGTWDASWSVYSGPEPDWSAPLAADCAATGMPASRWYGGHERRRGALFFDVVWPGITDSLGTVETVAE